jgi:hypothetical protein
MPHRVNEPVEWKQLDRLLGRVVISRLRAQGLGREHFPEECRQVLREVEKHLGPPRH